MANKNPNLILYISLVALILLFFFVNKSVQDLSESSTLREEKTVILEQNNNASANAKASLNNYWDEELLIAQQIENAVNFKTPEAAAKVLNNIEENLKYNRNKVAILFYLGDAYGILKNNEKALACYQQIRSKYNNGNVHLYILNTPRFAIKYKDYSVSIYEESILRQANLNSSTELLKSIAGAPGLYGTFKNEKFLYADLVRKNLYRLYNNQPFVTSAEQYWRQAIAENTIYSFLGELANPSALYASSELIANVGALNKLREYPNRENLKFTLKDIRSSGLLHYYSFTSEDGNITIVVLDDNKTTLVSDILFKENSTENTEPL